MNIITKEDLVNAKDLVKQVLEEKKQNSKTNIIMKEYNFNTDIYPIITTLGLSTIAFNDGNIMKTITVLAGILTYEELRYILVNLKNILLAQKKLNLLTKSKYEKLLSMITTDEYKEINYLDAKGSSK